MSRGILVGVGGTGQEIALATLRLCHMANIMPPKVYILDGDQDDTDPSNDSDNGE